MRICLEKSTGLLIESQSFASEGTLIKNAIKNGFLESEVEEKVVSINEYQQILESLPKPQQSLSEIEKLRLEQAQANAELFEMMLMLTGGGAP
ncbi:hypothetical protein V7149_00115 [Bacillus sp. JJ1503]|uniref:hypothetical protein n=1 Tax=Bacillus sp. JJ1503 TaxID=3122956 RepID=UPI002FFF989A